MNGTLANLKEELCWRRDRRVVDALGFAAVALWLFNESYFAAPQPVFGTFIPGPVAFHANS